MKFSDTRLNSVPQSVKTTVQSTKSVFITTQNRCLVKHPHHPTFAGIEINFGGIIVNLSHFPVFLNEAME
jgi:hypothetical protein